MTTSPTPRTTGADPARLDTTTLLVLVIGSVAAAACAFGPVWLVRLGVAIALAMAVTCVLLTWRQMNRLVAAHLAEVAELREAARTRLREAEHAHHVESMEMIERFTARKEALAADLAAARQDVAELRAQLAAGALDIEAKQTRISALNKRVADLERELADEADVTNLPRRVAGRVDVSRLPLVYPAQRMQA